MIKLNAETVMRFVLVRSRMKALTKKEKVNADAIKEVMDLRAGGIRSNRISVQTGHEQVPAFTGGLRRHGQEVLP